MTPSRKTTSDGILQELMDDREPHGQPFPQGTSFEHRGERLEVVRFLPSTEMEPANYEVRAPDGREGVVWALVVEQAFMTLRIAALKAERDAAASPRP